MVLIAQGRVLALEVFPANRGRYVREVTVWHNLSVVSAPVFGAAIQVPEDQELATGAT